MDQTARLAYAAKLREEYERAAQEERAERERVAALDRCDECRKPKGERHDLLVLTSGLRMTVDSWHCTNPAPNCTAQACSHFVSNTPEQANRLVKWTAGHPGLSQIGVTWMACMAPDGKGADRLILTYRIAALERVIAVLEDEATIELLNSNKQ